MLFRSRNLKISKGSQFLNNLNYQKMKTIDGDTFFKLKSIISEENYLLTKNNDFDEAKNLILITKTEKEN